MRYASALHLGRGLSLVTSVLVLGLALPTSAARAQFVCGGNATGAGVLTGDGATASAPNGVACGTNANATGAGGTTATGASAGTSPGLATNKLNTFIGCSIGRDVGDRQQQYGDRRTGRLRRHRLRQYREWFPSRQSGKRLRQHCRRHRGPASASPETATPRPGSLPATTSPASTTPLQATAPAAKLPAVRTPRPDRTLAAISPAGSNTATGVGAGSFLTGSGNVAMGNNAGSGNFSTPLTASNTVSIGTFAAASKDDAIAIGRNSTAAFTNSAAFGQGAASTRPNQQVFGTSVASGGPADSTDTMPGITSAASKAAQGAFTEIVTTNANGDLASQTIAQLGSCHDGRRRWHQYSNR